MFIIFEYYKRNGRWKTSNKQLTVARHTPNMKQGAYLIIMTFHLTLECSDTLNVEWYKCLPLAALAKITFNSCKLTEGRKDKSVYYLSYLSNTNGMAVEKKATNNWRSLVMKQIAYLIVITYQLMECSVALYDVWYKYQALLLSQKMTLVAVKALMHGKTKGSLWRGRC